MAKRVVLSISDDASLLLTRKFLLEQLGHEVVTAQGFTAVRAICESNDASFDLIVLCHSISHGDKKRIIAYLRLRCRSPILVLLRPHESSIREADASVESDPQVLVAAVRKLLR